jgi:putative cell wall-binding protein
MRKTIGGSIALVLVLALMVSPPAEAAAPLRVGVVDSESTYVNFAQQGWWNERPPRVAQALTDAGFTVVVLGDADVADRAKLDSLDVLFLPLVRVMSEDAAITIRDWVADGGGLVASFISPRMLNRPGCQWTGGAHPRYTSDLAANWTCWGTTHGGFEFWARELNSSVWEYGPLSEPFQNVFINDPTPTDFSVTQDAAGASHPIITETLAALGITNIRLDRPQGAGAEFTRLFNSNTTSLLEFDIAPGTPSAPPGVDVGQYDGYTAAQAIEYEQGRIVYYDFSIVDFLAGVCPWPDLPCDHTHQGVKQGDIAKQLIAESIDWVASPTGVGTVDRHARTWAEVDVYNTGIYLRQKVVGEGNMGVLGHLVARIYDPSGVLVYENRKDQIGLYPGGPVLSYSLPSYTVGTGLRTDGSYRVEVQYVYSYPDYEQVHVEAVNVTRNQGKGILTSPVFDGPLPERWAGPDRYSTAAAISQATFSPGVAVAYVATSANFPDALAGGAAAAGSGPILLVAQTGIPAATASELNRLKPGQIVVLGGTGAVSSQVQTQLGSYTSGSVIRLAGSDRYATAAAVSKAHFAPGVPIAYVATGLNFPDALAGGPAAATAGGPILLTSPDVLPAATAAELERLEPNRIVVLGGSGVISDPVLNDLRTFAPKVARVAGLDRYSTAAAVSSSVFSSGVPVVFVATGQNYPDALAGGTAAAVRGGPILLVTASFVPSATRAEILRLQPSEIIVLGGSGAVSDGVLAELAWLTS